MTKKELKKYLEEQAVWDREINEIFESYMDLEDYDLETFKISQIYDSAYDFGEEYFSDVLGIDDSILREYMDFSDFGQWLCEHGTDSDRYFYCSSSDRVIVWEEC